MTNITISWITDPILYRDTVDKIKKQVKKCSLVETPINELTKFTLSCPQPSASKLDKIKELVNDIKYPYLSVHLDTNNWDEYNNMFDAVKKLFQADQLVFTPMGANQKPIYIPMNSDQYIYPVNPINLDEYVGYTYLGSNPLLIYILKKLGVSRDYVKLYAKDHFFISDPVIASSVILELTRLSPNHFVTDELPLRYYQLYKELITMNNSQIVDTLTPNRLVICSSLPSKWFKKAISRVSEGELPIYTFWDSFKPNLLISESSQAKLYYTCYRSYVDMINIYPLLKKSLPNLVVSDQLMVRAPFHTLDASEQFSQFVSGYLSHITDLAVTIVSTETEALYYRWSVVKEHPDLITLITPAGQAYAVVSNGPVIISKKPNQRIRNTLEHELRVYLERKCQDVYERSTLTELLNIVPVDGGCLTAEDVTFLTHLSLETLTSDYPATLERFTLSDDLLYRIQSHRLSLYGIFSYGPIPGLLQHQSPLYLKPSTLSSNITVETNHQVTIWHIDDHPLIWQLSSGSPNLGTITKAIKHLWTKGWFLSDWCQAMLLTTHNPSVAVGRRNLLLNYLGLHPKLLSTYLKNET
jgi:hypothetical protein